MERHIVTILAIMTLVSAPALAAVWVSQTSSGSGGSDVNGSGNSGSCYLVNFNAGGSKQLFGLGTVNGNTFSGFVASMGLPDYGKSNRRYYQCSSPASGDCAWNYAYSGGSRGDGSNYIVSVSGLPVTSVLPIPCMP